MTLLPLIRVSVLIPAYNQGRYLEETLRCVFGQSLSPFEVVVVDDGSTDDTETVLEPFRNRIRYHRQEHAGIGASRNRCLAMAKGNALAFLDADDLWPEKSLELRARVLAENPDVDGVVGMVEQFLSPDVSPELRHRFHVPEGATVARLAGATLLRRDAVERVGRFDQSLKVGETVDWVARAQAAGVRIDPIRELVLRRRIHGENTVTREDNSSDYLGC